MAREGEVFQPDTADVQIPWWEWNDPWSWITVILLVLETALFLAYSGRIADGAWVGVLAMLAIAANCHRCANFLRKAGEQPKRVIRFEYWAVAYLWFGVFFSLASLGYVRFG